MVDVESAGKGEAVKCVKSRLVVQTYCSLVSAIAAKMDDLDDQRWSGWDDEAVQDEKEDELGSTNGMGVLARMLTSPSWSNTCFVVVTNLNRRRDGDKLEQCWSLRLVLYIEDKIRPKCVDISVNSCPVT